MAKEKVQEQNDELIQVAVNHQNVLNTHVKINTSLSGEVLKLGSGYAKIALETIEAMRADEVGLVHGGFIFSAADFAAMAAVNEPNVVLASSSCLFLAPVRVGDTVIFEANEHQTEGRKRNVSVKGFVLDIKVFEGDFKTVVTEHHVLRLDLMKNMEKESKNSDRA